MRKKILITVGVLIAIVVGGMLYLNNRNRTLSPPGQAELTAHGLSVSVDYSRPSVRNRVIFGTEEEDALQPYGKYWRFGANESTEITIDKDVTFNGESLKAGTYKIYAFPGQLSFEVGVNKETGTWGYFEPDYEQDVFRTEVEVISPTVLTEQHTISLEETTTGIMLITQFEHVRLEIPIEPQ
ncbi:MAG: DUF2911 domain-containing protein [Leptolyngbya sp. SIO3F4]|nr:DUF2911 domain-containing protein [Leptolyngbya sp. SIO3F4]